MQNQVKMFKIAKGLMLLNSIEINDIFDQITTIRVMHYVRYTLYGVYYLLKLIIKLKKYNTFKIVYIII